MALSLSRTLCSQALLKHAISMRSPITAAVASNRFITLKVVPKPTEPAESHDERNMRLHREMSPHLTIYKFQLTSMLSITHRITGMALAGYAVVLGVGALVLPHDFSHYITMIEGLNLGAASLFTIKYILAFPAAFHTCNGIRHLFWDMGKFLKIREVYSTGYIMMASTIGLTILLSLI